jgi:hypothetical protein
MRSFLCVPAGGARLVRIVSEQPATTTVVVRLPLPKRITKRNSPRFVSLFIIFFDPLFVQVNMGVLLAKPRTIADLDNLKTELKTELKADLDNLKTELKTELKADLDNLKTDLKTDLNATLQPLMDALLVPDGDTESQRIAVAVRDTDSYGLIGHGAIVCLQEKNEGSRATSGLAGTTTVSTTPQSNYYYLCSAAHVLIDIATSENNTYCTIEGRRRR